MNDQMKEGMNGWIIERTGFQEVEYATSRSRMLHQNTKSLRVEIWIPKNALRL